MLKNVSMAKERLLSLGYTQRESDPYETIMERKDANKTYVAIVNPNGSVDITLDDKIINQIDYRHIKRGKLIGDF